MMIRSKAILPAKVDMLTPIERLPNSKLRCVCDCGNERICRIGHFNAGNVRSCGCTKFTKVVEGATGPCIVEGCNAERCNSKGWCWMHYTRWRRHGDPLHTERGKPQEWLDAHAGYEGDDCLPWPFGGRDNGYGTMIYDGDHCSAHRKMCELRHGPAPTPRHEAAHSCGKGHEGCVNPNHLSWKTPSENNLDKLLHGTHNRGERHFCATLTEQIVREARDRYRPFVVTCKMLAAEYGVGEAAIKLAIQRRTWRWLK